MIIVQRFIAGKRCTKECFSPEGTTENMDCLGKHRNSSAVPTGLRSTDRGIRDPEVNCWAIIKCPSGTKTCVVQQGLTPWAIICRPFGTEETRDSLKTICLCDFTIDHRIERTSTPFLNSCHSCYSWFPLLVAAEGRAKLFRKCTSVET